MTTEPNKNISDQLTENARSFVLNTYGQRQDGRLIVHNYSGAQEIARITRELGSQEGLPADQITALEIAALFLPLGFLYDYRQPAPFSIEFANQFLKEENLPDQHKTTIRDAISQVLTAKAPHAPASKVLADAYHAMLYLQPSEIRHAQLQLERELMLNQRLDKTEWIKRLLEELLRVQLFTHSAQAAYQPLLSQSIYQYRALLEKRLEKEVDTSLPFMELEKKAPIRGVQTYFRTNYRNHINLSAIADNKANIMIGINAILISVLITFLSYRNIGENQPKVLLPIIIFMTSGLASLIFAVLSVRPKVTKLHSESATLQEVKKNITFFGNFIQLPVAQYEAAMEEVFKDSHLLYGNMVRDLYYLGKVLDKKYRFLSMSYNIFMIGLAATVFSFLIALFL
jgi:hypothetical protein